MPAAANVMRVKLALPSGAMVIPAPKLVVAILTAVATVVLPVWSFTSYAEIYARPAISAYGIVAEAVMAAVPLPLT